MSRKTLAVSVGWGCQMACSHCMVHGGTAKFRGLKSSDHPPILRALQTHKYSTLLITGGEPSLYPVQVKGLISAVEKNGLRSGLKVKLFSNGVFIRTLKGPVKKAVGNIDILRVSMDTLHQNGLAPAELTELQSLCRDEEIRLSVSICVSTPRDFALLKFCKEQEIETEISSVRISGRGANLPEELRQLTRDLKADEPLCDALDKMSYIPGLGFTWCPSFQDVLQDNAKNADAYFASDANNVSELQIYQEIKARSVGNTLNILRKNRLALSDRCIACRASTRNLK